MYDTEHMWDEEDHGPSKSQKKRESAALQKMGEELAELDASQLRQMEMPSELLYALLDVQEMHQHGARKRQFKFIGKLLRGLDPDGLQETLDTLHERKRETDLTFHLTERWRDRLIDEGDTALALLMQDYPQADAHQLRQLIRNTQRERRQNKPPKSSRQLFRLLRDLLA
ncbi:MAG TPA: ribosome biogenesis factor YjgA [Mariprofundaceae bacterium]|nr:ribosome biogenesis factor YjgA [Mariprofundaceae bacterium]